jgi:hypothetical protein
MQPLVWEYCSVAATPAVLADAGVGGGKLRAATEMVQIFPC